MAKVYESLSQNGEHYGWAIKCPACNCNHLFDNRWTFNGDMENPTFRASMLVSCGHYSSNYKEDGCWCTYNKEHPDKPSPFKCSRCHSFVTDGKIEFLSDCTHEFAGQTLMLEDI